MAGQEPQSVRARPLSDRSESATFPPKGKGRTRIGGQRGFGFIEILVAIAITASILIAAMSAFSTAAITVGKAQTRVNAQTVARAQMEAVANATYVPAPTPYPTIVPLTGFTIVVSVAAIATATAPLTGTPAKDALIEKVTVTVTGKGQTFTAQTYKAGQ